jgi:hypothetical protein
MSVPCEELERQLREANWATGAWRSIAQQNDARVGVLEALLCELIDIEGPQPGHIEWYRRVQAALRRESSPATQEGEHGN